MNGLEVIPVAYDELKWDVSEGLIGARKDQLWGFIDTANQIVIPFQYEYTSGFSEGLAAVTFHDKLGFIDKNNEVKIPFQFEPDWRSRFKEGLSVVRIQRNYGYINRDGEMVVPPTYYSALAFKNRCAHVELKDGSKILIDPSGRQLTLPMIEIWRFNENRARAIPLIH